MVASILPMNSPAPTEMATPKRPAKCPQAFAPGPPTVQASAMPTSPTLANQKCGQMIRGYLMGRPLKRGMT